MKSNLTSESQKPGFVIRVHLTDGSVESFAQADAAQAQNIWQTVEPARLFAQPRLVIAGEHSKSVFVSAHILRVDFIQDTFDCWEFPCGYSDVVELSEDEFRARAHLDRPELMPKREQHTPTGDLLVSFIKLHTCHDDINPTRIVPIGPLLDLISPHGREKLPEGQG